MKKQELLDQLAEKYEDVGTSEKVGELNKTKNYDVTVFEVSDGGSIFKTVPFYVKDEGLETEEAYLRVAEAVTAPTFNDEILAEIENQVSLKNILTGTIVEANEKSLFAVVKGFIATETGASQKMFLYRKNGEAIDILTLE